MRCLSPISLVRNDIRQNVPCGKCIACLSRKRQEWLFRIEAELRVSSSAFFVTLTYDDQYMTVNDDNQGLLMKTDLQNFIKRLRWYVDRYYTGLGQDPRKHKKLRYYCVGEYGSNNNRPHYHCLLFNLPIDPIEVIRERKILEFLKEVWKFGIIHVGKVESASINYSLAYIIIPKVDQDNLTRQFAVMSTKPPIGINYLSKNQKFHKSNLTDVTTLPGGQKIMLPRLFRDKIFNKAEKRYLTERSQRQQEDRQKKEFNKIMEQTDNFGLHDLAQKEMLTNKFKKSLKNKKL